VGNHIEISDKKVDGRNITKKYRAELCVYIMNFMVYLLISNSLLQNVVNNLILLLVYNIFILNFSFTKYIRLYVYLLCQ